jgi:hypothetical protein
MVFGAWYYCQICQLIGHDARSKAGQPVRSDPAIRSGPAVRSGPNNDESAILPKNSSGRAVPELLLLLWSVECGC